MQKGMGEKGRGERGEYFVPDKEMHDWVVLMDFVRVFSICPNHPVGSGGRGGGTL